MFTAAPSTRITGFSIAICPQVTNGYTAVLWDQNMSPVLSDLRLFPDGSSVSSTMACHGVPPYWSNARNVAQRQALATAQLRFVASCLLCDFLFTRGSIEISSFRASIRDDSVPTVRAVRGALATNEQHVGAEVVEFDAADAGVGVYRAVAETRLFGQGEWSEIASVQVGAGRASCVPLRETTHPYEFDNPQPCPLTVSGARLTVDNARLPAGQHELRVMVEDASGNRSPVIAARQHVIPAPPAADRPVVLRIANAGRRALSAPKAFRVRGSATDTAGQPLGGVPLTVRSQPFLPKPAISSGAWSVLGEVTTAADGTFDVRVPAGASRTIQITRDAAAGLSAAAAQVDVVVPAQVTARARSKRVRNGRSAVITGRVAGPIPSGGVLVALEVREPGRWIPVATTRRWVRTTKTGRFRLSYRFRRTFQPVTYRFRVVADEDSAFSYTRGVSRTIAVHVKP